MSQKDHCENSEVLMFTEADDEPSTFSARFNIIKSNTPKSLQKFLSRNSAIIIIIGVLTILTVLLLIHLLSKKNHESEIELELEELNFSQKIIFSDLNKIKIFDLKTKETSVFLETTNEITAIEVVNRSIFYIEANSSTLSSYSETIDDVPLPVTIQPKTFAVDTLTKKIYILDEYVGTVTVIDMVNSYYGVVLSDLGDPQDIVIDIQHGFMFIVQYSRTILRANLDGTNLTAIVKDKRVTNIALDRKRKNIFFVHEDSKISSVDYEGLNEVVFENFESPVMNLEIIGDQLFWQPYPHFNGLKRNSLFSCGIFNKTCENHKNFPIYSENLKMFKGHVDLSSLYEMNNPCKTNNGGCSDLCLLTSKQSKSCACHLGFKLNNDTKSCSPVTDFIIYTENNIVRAVSVENQNAFKDMIIPKPFTAKFSEVKFTVDYDYDLRNDNFIFSDGNSIYKMKIMDGSPQKLVVSADSYNHINDISFDRLSNNLYYFEQSNDINAGGLMTILSNINSDSNFKKIILKTGNSNDQVSRLYVWENLGYLIYVRWNEDKDIHSMKLDGSETISLHQLIQISTFKIILAIDYDDNQIYFVDENKKNFISHANLGFQDLTMHSHSVPVNNMTSMSINKQYIFVSNQTSIWRLDKEKCENVVQIVPKHITNTVKKISGVKVFSTSRTFNKNENPCAYKNGNCEQFCFSKPKKSCGCVDGQNLENSLHCH